LSEKLTNWTLSNRRRRIEVPIGVAYDCAPREVQALLLDVASKIEGISLVTPPAVLFVGFGESSLDFVVRVWTDDFDLGADIRSELALDIHAALKAAGIEIPFPQRDLHIRSVAPEALAPTVQPHTPPNHPPATEVA
jgi:potassium-dependent mechanosensitive channel